MSGSAVSNSKYGPDYPVPITTQYILFKFTYPATCFRVPQVADQCHIPRRVVSKRGRKARE
jgi:hypothetical protein